MALAQATGCIAGPMDRLRQCFEQSEPWADFVNGTTHEKFIFNIQDEPSNKEEFSETELNAQRPLVYFVPDYPQAFTIVSDADDGSFRSGGVINAYLETTVEHLRALGTADTQQEVARLWDNLISRFLVGSESIFCIGWNNTILDIRRIDSLMLHTPNTVTQHGQGEFVKASFKVHWGRDV